MKRTIVLTFIMGLLAWVGCSAQKIDNSVVASVDLEKFLGSWYEIARFDHIFERGMQETMAHYALLPDGKIEVINSGIKEGKSKSSKGKAKLTETPGLLRVSFFGPFYSDYRIMMLDSEYQHVLIGSGSSKYLWILSRTPQLTEDVRTKILDEATRRGYDISKLIWVEHK